MVDGARPFAFPRACDIFAFKSRVDKDEPPPPKKLNPKIDDSLNDLILHGLDKKLDRRFLKAQDMLNALNPYLRGEDPIELDIGQALELLPQSKEAEAERFIDNLMQK